VGQALYSGVARLGLLSATPHTTSHPTTQIFGRCNLQSAIDFAELRSGREVAKLGMRGVPRVASQSTTQIL